MTGSAGSCWVFIGGNEGFPLGSNSTGGQTLPIKSRVPACLQSHLACVWTSCQWFTLKSETGLQSHTDHANNMERVSAIQTGSSWSQTDVHEDKLPKGETTKRWGGGADCSPHPPTITTHTHTPNFALTTCPTFSLSCLSALIAYTPYEIKTRPPLPLCLYGTTVFLIPPPLPPPSSCFQWENEASFCFFSPKEEFWRHWSGKDISHQMGLTAGVEGKEEEEERRRKQKRARIQWDQSFLIKEYLWYDNNPSTGALHTTEPHTNTQTHNQTNKSSWMKSPRRMVLLTSSLVVPERFWTPSPTEPLLFQKSQKADPELERSLEFPSTLRLKGVASEKTRGLR